MINNLLFRYIIVNIEYKNNVLSPGRFGIPGDLLNIKSMSFKVGDKVRAMISISYAEWKFKKGDILTVTKESQADDNTFKSGELWYSDFDFELVDSLVSKQEIIKALKALKRYDVSIVGPYIEEHEGIFGDYIKFEDINNLIKELSK